MQKCAPLVLFGLLYDIIVNFNEPKIIENGGELSDLEYLLTKTQYTKYLQIADTRTSRLLNTFKQQNSRFQQAQYHRKQWRIE